MPHLQGDAASRPRRPEPRPICCGASSRATLDPASSYVDAAIKEVTDYCIVCGMCALECPSNVNIPKLMLEAKSKYRQAHRGSPTDTAPRPCRGDLGPRQPPRAPLQPLLSQPLSAAWRSP